MQVSDDVTGGAPVERIGLGARVVGILTSPRITFERVIDDPRWIGVLVLGVGAVAVVSSAFMSTEFAQRAILDEQIASMEASGQPASDEAYERMQDFVRYTPYLTFASVLLTVPIVCLILAGLLQVVGYGLLGAGTNFAGTFAVVAHAGVVFVAQQIFVVPLNYARQAVTSPSTLAAFAPTLDEDAFAYKLLSSVDLFYVWWVMILSIGLAVLWKRRTAPIATALYATYAAIVLIIAVARTNLGF